MITFSIGCFPFSEQSPSAPSGVGAFPRGRKDAGLRNRDEEVGTGPDRGRDHPMGGWEVALKAAAYFLRPEGFLPRGKSVFNEPREPSPQREPMGLCLSAFNTLT
jgi:hypothetical protein